MTTRRPVLAVIGSGGSIDVAVEQAAEALGRAAIEAGFRIVCGGRDGVMEASSRGARSAANWREGDVIGILPGYERRNANPFVDIVIPTGLGIARNVVVVASADVVVAIAGGSGTLSEIAIACDRRSDQVQRACSVAEAIEQALAVIAEGS